MLKLGVNPASKVGKKHVSRKLKSSWRKHIDTTDIDNFLEEQRQDERIGTLEEKPNTELFTEEPKPSRPKLTLRELRKKKFTEMPKSLMVLKNTSNVEDPIAKRNIKKQPATQPKPVKSETRSSRQGGTRKVTTRPNMTGATKDIWGDDELPEELRSEWMGKEQLLHTMKHAGKTMIVKQPCRMDTVDKIAAAKKILPREGTSYNPAVEDYIELKNEVVEQEKQIMKKKAHFDRVVTNMFKKMTREQKDRMYREEMTSDVNKAAKVEAQEDDVDDATVAVVKVAAGAKRRKRSSKTKKREHHKKLYATKLLKDELVKLKEINRAEEINEELNELDAEAEKRALKRSSKASAPDSMPIDFIDPELLSGSLRTIQPLNNLIATGLPKVRKMSIFKHSRAEIARLKTRPLKKVSYVRRSHKIVD